MSVMADYAAAHASIPVSEWDFRTIGELASALQRRTISSSELVELTIARIEALDTRLNAIVVRDFERAREAAGVADTALSRGERRPLLGVPVTVKEAFNVAGLPTTRGYPQYKDYIPAQDALVVSRLKTAGAVILGKTNVPEGLGDSSPTTISTAPPIIRGTSAAPPAVRRAARRPLLPPYSVRCRLGPTSGARRGCPRTSAASMLTNPRCGM